MSRQRVVGFLLARRSSPRASPRTAPARSLHPLRDRPIGNGLLGAAGVAAAAALFGGGALAYFKNGPDDDDESAARKEEDMKARFEDWMKKYDKTYRDEEEKAMRFQLFKASVKHIESLPPSYQKGLHTGYFSDHKDEERPSGRSCIHLDEDDNEVLCENEKGELVIWRPNVKQGVTLASQVSA